MGGKILDSLGGIEITPSFLIELNPLVIPERPFLSPLNPLLAFRRVQSILNKQTPTGL